MQLHPQNKSKIICALLVSMLLTSTLLFFTALPQTKAAPIPITVIGPDGTSYTINDITSVPYTVGSGGYKSNTQLNWGNYQGISLLAICNSIGTTLADYQNVTVQTSSGATDIFDYEQVAAGTNISPQYKTYNNVTGAVQAPSQPVTLIVAYQFANGTALPGSSSTRLLIVGPEGLLFPGPGLAGVDNITITNVGAVPTTTPTPTPTPSPSPTPPPTASPSPSPEPTAQPTASATPTNSPSPTSAGSSSEQWPATYTVAIAAIIILSIIAVVAIVLRRK
jgi:hypothetical protein